MKKVALVRSISFSVLLAGCIEPYYPPEGSGSGGQLVIDGFLNASKKSVSIKLSRSIALGDALPIPPESKASVTIRSSSGVQYNLAEDENIDHAGNYSASNLLLNPSDKYTLHVVTASGQSYSSDDIELLDSPVLDSISWRAGPAGVNFFVSGHDPDNKTRYYRWTFVETFQYNAPYISYFKKVDDVVLPRIDDYVYYCWSSSNAPNIMVTSTIRLGDDVVSMFPIHFVPKGSRKMGFRYRLVVQQRAITQQEYDFWQLIRKTTETTGGLFDPIPSQVLGNIHNDDNPGDYVLGYFSGGYADEITKYVGHLELPGELRTVEPYAFDSDGITCRGRPVYLNQINTIDANEVILNTFGFPYVEGYIVVPRICGDCRNLYNGINVEPDDWQIF